MKKALLILLVGLTSAAYAQKIKLVEGDLSVLKDQKGVKTIFSYDDMSVGKVPKEADYVSKKKEEYNAKEAGTGDKWEKAWVDDRKERFEPQFRELFSKYAEMSTVAEDAPYTLIFKTTKTEPGWNIGITRAPAYIDAEAWIVKSDTPDKAIARITVTKAPGRDAFGYDFETGARLAESYAKAGKELGAFIKKNAK
jgi:hypothetical protein